MACKIASRDKSPLILLLASLLVSASGAWASPTTPQQAVQVVSNWLSSDAQPLGAPLGRQIKGVQVFPGPDGAPAYFVVYLNPLGLVFLPADDLVEPIIGFAPTGHYDPSHANPLGALVSRDVSGRVDRVRKLEAKARDRGVEFVPVGLERDARRKWELLAQDQAPSPLDFGLITISDPRVPPLTQTFWDQGDEGTSWCYNYYTPNHWLCGCAATALAQVMRYHRHPTLGVGNRTNKILIWNTQTNQFDIVDRTLLGGDGSGGPYDWNNMVLDPDAATADAQRRAFGALTYDAGVSVNMHYLPYMGDAIINDKKPLVNFFQYGKTVWASSPDASNIPSATLVQMVNPNLDAALPVMFRLVGSQGAHFIVGDGYGYNSATMYHHLNLGWGGSPAASQNVWYNLPDINSSPAFNTVTDCWYNIYPTVAGEIISGRALDQNNNPLPGALIAASCWAGTYTAATNSRGIYALRNLPANTSFTINGTGNGYVASTMTASTGLSLGAGSTQVGNFWGANLSFNPASTVTLNQALDNYALSFGTGGNAAWFGQNG